MKLFRVYTLHIDRLSLELTCVQCGTPMRYYAGSNGMNDIRRMVDHGRGPPCRVDSESGQTAYIYRTLLNNRPPDPQNIYNTLAVAPVFSHTATTCHRIMRTLTLLRPSRSIQMWSMRNQASGRRLERVSSMPFCSKLMLLCSPGCPAAR